MLQVKLLGAGSGFLAMNATMAARNVDLCQVPQHRSNIDIAVYPQPYWKLWMSAVSRTRRTFIRFALSGLIGTSTFPGLLPEMEIDLEKA